MVAPPRRRTSPMRHRLSVIETPEPVLWAWTRSMRFTGGRFRIGPWVLHTAGCAKLDGYDPSAPSAQYGFMRAAQALRVYSYPKSRVCGACKPIALLREEHPEWGEMLDCAQRIRGGIRAGPATAPGKPGVPGV